MKYHLSPKRCDLAKEIEFSSQAFQNNPWVLDINCLGLMLLTFRAFSQTAGAWLSTNWKSWATNWSSSCQSWGRSHITRYDVHLFQRTLGILRVPKIQNHFTILIILLITFGSFSVLTKFVTKATCSMISLKYLQAYNLITFDSLSGEQLLQILNDVLATIEKKPHQDIRWLIFTQLNIQQVQKT